MLLLVVYSLEQLVSIYHRMDNNVRMSLMTNFHHCRHTHTENPFRSNADVWFFSDNPSRFTFNAATATPPRAVDIGATVLHVLCSISYRSTVSKHVESSNPPTAYNGPPRQPTAIPRLNQRHSSMMEGNGK